MYKDLCKDCNTLLPPDNMICPVCGYDRETKINEDEAISEDFLDSLRDRPRPSYYQHL